MTDQHDPLRRALIAALASTPLLAVAGTGSPVQEFHGSGARADVEECF